MPRVLIVHPTELDAIYMRIGLGLPLTARDWLIYIKLTSDVPVITHN